MRKDPQLRIDAAYLANCSADDAYRWLETRSALGDAETAAVLEYVLLRRRSPLIDLGLACFGKNRRVRSRVYHRGNIGVRCAVWLNPDTGIYGAPVVPLDEATIAHVVGDAPEDQRASMETLLRNITVGGSRSIGQVVRQNRTAEIQAIALNAGKGHQSSELLHLLLTRTGPFEKLDDQAYRYCLVDIGQAKKLQYNEQDWADGDSHYLKGKCISAAWALTKILPATETWAETLFYLLEYAPAHDFESANEAIERWKIENLPDDYKTNSMYSLPYSLLLRSLIAQTIDREEDEAAFQRSNDLALRLLFYRKFNPHKAEHEDWPNFVELDGVPCFEAMCRNIAIWETAALRKQLGELANALDKKISVVGCGSDYEREEERVKSARPELFRPVRESIIRPTESELSRIIKENIRSVLFEFINFKTMAFYVAYALVVAAIIEYGFRTIWASLGM